LCRLRYLVETPKIGYVLALTLAFRQDAWNSVADRSRLGHFLDIFNASCAFAAFLAHIRSYGSHTELMFVRIAMCGSFFYDFFGHMFRSPHLG
jgi:hypothetical protein